MLNRRCMQGKVGNLFTVFTSFRFYRKFYCWPRPRKFGFIFYSISFKCVQICFTFSLSFAHVYSDFFHIFFILLFFIICSLIFDKTIFYPTVIFNWAKGRNDDRLVSSWQTTNNNNARLSYSRKIGRTSREQMFRRRIELDELYV